MTSVSGQQVAVKLSNQEAYVGAPILLHVVISDAASYKLPKTPKIDGCDVSQEGAPSTSSQTSIINGRISRRSSVIVRYAITPLREGEFAVPPLTIEVEGKPQRTEPLPFVATRSETGDLLFASLQGAKQKVYVGQAVDLTLKIWLKPYRDAKYRLTLSERDMWNCFSNRSRWGEFQKRLDELAKSNRRPGGREVLREDSEGRQRSYLLYEITSKAYPTKPGKIRTDDVQVVVNYPTSLGKAPDPFADLMNDSPFGGSPFGGRMFDDDFFRSPFSGQLQITGMRPLVAEIESGDTEVMPVPIEGRPSDYRGAVGHYQMKASANPVTVKAGDPILVLFEITGDGLMERVQAPPLASLPELAEFKVADQDLAGAVENQTKRFLASIRPNSEGVTEIPALPFSFFDPEAEQFRTVRTEPISIHVLPADQLALDAVVTGARPGGGDIDSTGNLDEPDWSIHVAPDALAQQSPRARSTLLWWLTVLPPVGWCLVSVLKHRRKVADGLTGLRSPLVCCQTALDKAASVADIEATLARFVSRTTRQPCTNSNAAVGQLRSAGMLTPANRLEAFLSQLSRQTESVGLCDLDASVRESLLQQAAALASQIAAERKLAAPLQKAGGLLVLSLALGSSAWAGLSKTQQERLFSEANQLYLEAVRDSASSDSPSEHQPGEQAKQATQDQLAQALGKYELLINDGVSNSRLLLNHGNACLQLGYLGRAIASFERARALAPGDEQVLRNLRYAIQQVAADKEHLVTSETRSGWTRLSDFNRATHELVGRGWFTWIGTLSWLVFWGLLTAKTAGAKFPVWRWAVTPLVVALLCAASLFLADRSKVGDLGIVVADELTLRSGDGNSFPETLSINEAQGRRLQVLDRRGTWLHVMVGRTEGWVPGDLVEVIE